MASTSSATASPSGGFGLQYTKVNKDFTDLPLTAGVLAGGGIRPRFLLALGYSFG